MTESRSISAVMSAIILVFTPPSQDLCLPRSSPKRFEKIVLMPVKDGEEREKEKESVSGLLLMMLV